MTYEQWTTKVGEHLNVDPTHIRFAPVLQNSGKPKPFIKRNATQNLQQILTSQYSPYGYSAHRPDALYYEVLETSLSEYETKKIIKVTWLPEGISKEVRPPPPQLQLVNRSSPGRLTNYTCRSNHLTFLWRRTAILAIYF